MKNFLFSAVLVLGLSTPFLQAQSSALTEAFGTSYTQEGKGDYTGAIKTLKALYVDNHYETNLRLGYLHYMAGLFTESMTYYQKAITLMPYGIEARMGYVLPAAAVGNWDKVEATYRKVLEIDPNQTIVNYRLGSILYGKKDYQNSLKYFEKVVNLYPFDYDSLLMFGWTQLQLGKYREARVLFNKVLLISPKDASALEGISLLK